jgi:hypothetical protein
MLPAAEAVEPTLSRVNGTRWISVGMKWAADHDPPVMLVSQGIAGLERILQQLNPPFGRPCIEIHRPGTATGPDGPVVRWVSMGVCRVRTGKIARSGIKQLKGPILCPMSSHIHKTFALQTVQRLFHGADG